jgi:hypothetical protein
MAGFSIASCGFWKKCNTDLRDIPTAARCTSTELILLSELKIPMLSP